MKLTLHITDATPFILKTTIVKCVLYLLCLTRTIIIIICYFVAGQVYNSYKYPHSNLVTIYTMQF